MHRLQGRTGRFGRKGVSINFVHNDRTWNQMREIENALGKQMVRIDTDDVDVMEKVDVTFLHLVYTGANLSHFFAQQMKQALK